MFFKDCRTLAHILMCYGTDEKCKQWLKGNKQITQHAKDKPALFLYSECPSGIFIILTKFDEDNYVPPRNN